MKRADLSGGLVEACLLSAESGFHMEKQCSVRMSYLSETNRKLVICTNSALFYFVVVAVGHRMRSICQQVKILSSGITAPFLSFILLF